MKTIYLLPKSIYFLMSLSFSGLMLWYSSCNDTEVPMMKEVVEEDTEEEQPEQEDPFNNNYQLVEMMNIAMAWSAPGSTNSYTSSSTPINANSQFPESVNMASATFATTSNSSNVITGVNEVGKKLISQFPFNTFYNQNSLNFSVATATGDLNGDGRDELITVSANATSGGLVLNLAGSDTITTIIDSLVATTLESGAIAKPTIALATGDFNNDQKDEIIVAWIDGTLKIRQIDASDISNPVLGTTYTGASYSNSGYFPQLSITTGDYDGDGSDDLAIGASNDAAHTDLTTALNLNIYSVSSNGTITAKGTNSSNNLAITQPAYESTSIGVAGQLSLTSGDVNGDNMDELIVAWGQPSGSTISGYNFKSVNSNVSIYQITSNLSTFSNIGSLTGTDTWDFIYVRVEVGDFNLDLIDEVVVATAGYQNGSSKLSVDIYSYDQVGQKINPLSNYPSTDFVGSTLSNWPGGSFWNFIDLAVGDLNGDLEDEVILAIRPSSSTCATCFSMQIFDVNPTSYALTNSGVSYNKEQTMGYSSGQNSWIGGHIDIALGDFSGNSIWVGPPTVHNIDTSKVILALINEPPKHLDMFITGTDTNYLNVNNNSSSYVTYMTAQSQSTDMGVELSRTYTTSNSLKASLSQAEALSLSASIDKTYGSGFTNKNDTLTSLTFGSQVSARMDDNTIIMNLGYTAWEYPTYTGTDTTPQGTILVIFPDNPSGNGNIEYNSGTNLGSYYKPNHETANLLSYPTTAPVDIETNILQNPPSQVNITNGSDFQLYADWSKIITTDSTETQNQSITKGGGISAAFTKFFTFGLDISTKSVYDTSTVSTVKTTFKESTSINVNIASLAQSDETYAFSVTPYIYWSTYGYLVVDYKVSIPIPATGDNGWTLKYGKLPDPGFSLPMRFNNIPDYVDFSREIEFNYDENGVPTSIVAVVHNYSLLQTPVPSVNVACYLGDPDNGGTQIGTTQTLSSLGKLATMSATFDWVPPDTSDTYIIYCVIDPDDTLTEIHEWNNKAWAKYPGNELQ